MIKSGLAVRYNFPANGGIIEEPIATQLCLELGLSDKFDAPSQVFAGIAALAAIVDERDPAYFVSVLYFHGLKEDDNGYWVHVAPKAKYRREDLKVLVKVLSDQMERRFAGLRFFTAEDFNKMSN